MKNIFIIGSCFPAELGGPSNTIFRLSSILKSYTDVEIWTTMNGITPELKNKYNIVENKIVNINGVKVVFFELNSLNVISFKLLLSVLNSNKNDVFHLNSVFYFLNIFIFILLFFKGNKYTFSPRGELFDAALKNKKIMKDIYLKFVGFFIKRANKIIVTSEYELSTSNDKLNLPESRYYILPNFQEIPDKLQSIKKDKNVVLFLGRINKHKCIENLFKAVYLSGIPLKLRVCGCGDNNYLNELIVLAEQLNLDVDFLGHVIGENKNYILQKSSILVLPSKSENFGNVILEALALGTPVIACKNSPWTDLPKFNCGYFTKNDPFSLAVSINLFFSKTAIEMDEMSINANKYAKAKYCLNKNKNKIKDAFNCD